MSGCQSNVAVLDEIRAVKALLAKAIIPYLTF